MSEHVPAPGSGSESQTFLVGPNLYLRPVRLSDAATAAIWRDSPFPAPAEVVEERLKKRLDAGQHEEFQRQLLIACRRNDDQPAGSVQLIMNGWRYAVPRVAIDPLASGERREKLFAELLDLLIPWLLGERNVMTLEVITHEGQSLVEQTVAAHGGREAVRLRELLILDGQRRDLLSYQIFNPVWIEKLGPPPEPVQGNVERTVASPARRSRRVSGAERPTGAFMVGERIYLRPFKPDEAAMVEAWSLQETEVVYPEGRALVNAYAYGQFHKSMAETEPPERLRFAIALRETGELIGANGLMDINWINRTAETDTDIFRREHRNAGYGTEAKHLVLEYAFERLGLHAIYAYVAETNHRSAAALRKQGYRDAGYAAWESFAPDGLCGGWLFDLLADEWRAARDAVSDPHD